MTSSNIYVVLLISILVYTRITISTGTSHGGSFGRNFYVGILKPFSINVGEVALLITSANITGNVNIHVPYLKINTTRSFTGYFEFNITDSIIPSTVNTVEHKGIHVTSDIDVSLVVVTSPFTNSGVMRETFLSLPTDMISTSYIISSYTVGTGGPWDSNFLILATENDTAVTLTNNKVIQAPVSLSMKAMDTYLYASSEDLSGTLVQSNKPIAVFSGHEATGVPHGCPFNHYMAEQLLPTELFEREFIVSTMPPKSSYVVRVYGSETNTTINYTLSSRNDKKLLAFPGEFYEITGQDKPLKVYSNKPVQVILYSTCYVSSNSSYEAMGSTMSIIPATHQYANAYFFSVSSLFGEMDHYIAIMANDINIEDGLRMNGRRLQGMMQSYNMSLSDISYIVNIYKVNDGVYKLEHVNGLRFGALQYGFGRDNRNAYTNSLGLTTVDCEHLSPPTNGKVMALNGTRYLSQAVYECNYGYELQGESMRICNASGNWSGTTPRCEAKANHRNTTDRLTCLQCRDVYHTNLCNTITQCAQGEICFVEKFTTHNGQIRYNMGCTESKQCNIHQRSQNTEKRSANCIECCSSDLCNFAGCGSQGLPDRNHRGPLCYDCAFTYNMNECKSISLCNPYESCSIEKYDWGGLYDRYTTECKSSQCLSAKRSETVSADSRKMSRSTPVCQHCCDNDLCNSYCNVTSQTGPGVAIIG